LSPKKQGQSPLPWPLRKEDGTGTRMMRPSPYLVPDYGKGEAKSIEVGQFENDTLSVKIIFGGEKWSGREDSNL
jgi:hypothetical protein